MKNTNSSPIDLYDMVLDKKHTPVRYAIVKHRKGERKPVDLSPLNDKVTV